MAFPSTNFDALVKVFVQRSRDGLFLRTLSVWVSSQSEAKAFANCTPAIDFCVENGIKEVRLCLSFGDPKYDLFLEVFRAETRALVKFNRDLRAQRELALRKLDAIRAESKERKKQVPFIRKPSRQKTPSQRLTGI